ncbi:MAG: hypothetical protein BME94_00640 [Methanobacteriales archaeon Met13]
MKKLAILGVVALIVGMVPIYALDNNSTACSDNCKLKSTPQHQFKNAIGHQMKNGIGRKYRNSKRHQQLEAKIEALKTSDPNKYQQIQKLKTQINTLRQQIHTLRQQNKTANQSQIQVLRNQIKDKRTQIRALLGL